MLVPYELQEIVRRQFSESIGAIARLTCGVKWFNHITSAQYCEWSKDAIANCNVSALLEAALESVVAWQWLARQNEQLTELLNEFHFAHNEIDNTLNLYCRTANTDWPGDQHTTADRWAETSNSAFLLSADRRPPLPEERLVAIARNLHLFSIGDVLRMGGPSGPRLVLRKCERQCILDGTPYAINDDGVLLIDALMKSTTSEGWVSISKQTPITRPHRVRKELPEALQDVVEVAPRWGQRLRSDVRETLHPRPSNSNMKPTSGQNVRTVKRQQRGD